MTLTSLLGVAAVVLLLPRLLMAGDRPRAEVSGPLLALWWINRLLCGLLHRLEIRNASPLPPAGPAILIANHTCGIDNFLLQASCRRVLGFIIAQEWYDHWLCQIFCRILGCIPVKRDGRDLAATRAALRALKDGRVVPIFPEGRIYPTSGREIGPGKPGAAFIALESRAPVIPAYIRGTPATNDVLLALRTPSSASVRFGPPLDLSGFVGRGRAGERQALDQVTALMMRAIDDLRRQSIAEEGPLPPWSAPPEPAAADSPP